MKKSFFFALLSAMSINISAQLEINSDGKAIVGRSNYTDIALQSHGCIYAPLLGNEELVHSVSSGSTSHIQKIADNELEGENARLKQAMMQSAIGCASQSESDGIAYGLTGMRKSQMSGVSIRKGMKTATNR